MVGRKFKACLEPIWIRILNGSTTPIVGAAELKRSPDNPGRTVGVPQ